MIRLNDINKTVIDENEIKGYGAFNDSYYENEENVDRESISAMLTMGGVMIHYDSKELRDKDIELLDNLLDVKSIEDKGNAYPHEVDALKFAMSGIKKECGPVKEEYLTWEEVESGKSLTTYTKALLNGKTVFVRLNNVTIRLYDEEDGLIMASFYSENLFNALKLRRVE